MIEFVCQQYIAGPVDIEKNRRVRLYSFYFVMNCIFHAVGVANDKIHTQTFCNLPVFLHYLTEMEICKYRNLNVLLLARISNQYFFENKLKYLFVP